jgi:cell division septum initiation protein DivIVA
MSHQHIKDRIRQHNRQRDDADFNDQAEQCNAQLLEFILSEIAKARQEGQTERRFEHRLLALLEKVEHNQNQIMISEASLTASADRNEKAVHTLVNALPGNSVPSTPDTIVAAFQGRVDGNSAAAEAAVATASTGATTQPPAAP